MRTIFNIPFIKTRVGIGDILHIKAQLDAVKSKYKKIYIFPDDEVIRLYRNNDDNYRKFLDGLFKLLFAHSPYITHPNFVARLLAVTEDPHTLRRAGVTPRVPNLAEELCDGSPNSMGSYVVVSSKVRGIKRNEYEQIKDIFFDLLKKISKNYPIVVIGERNIGSNAEYIYHGNDRIYPIYKDIISAISADRLVDMTVPELGFTSPDLTRFRQECTIQHNAKHVITIGSGGNVSIAMSVGNILGYYGNSDMEVFFTHMLENGSRDGVFLTTDIKSYFDKLASI